MPEGPADSSTQLLVAHGLRLKSCATAGAVALWSGCAIGRVRAELTSLAADGYAIERAGVIAGWQLTTVGRTFAEELLAAELDGLGLRPLMTRAHAEFLVLNPVLLAVCTDWQLRPDPARSESLSAAVILNDHGDPSWDAGVIDRLAEIHLAVAPICESLQGALSRFGSYSGRFDNSIARIRRGDHTWVARPTIDSYHSVWFELHEDLIATLGIDRHNESEAH